MAQLLTQISKSKSHRMILLSVAIFCSFYIIIDKLMMRVKKWKAKAQNYKIILVGDDGVGKTTLFKKYLDDNSKTPEQITTVDCRNKMLNLHDKTISLSIWDTAGQEKFRSVIATYFKSCHGAFFVFDIGNRTSWINVQTIWYEMASTYSPNAVFLLIGNKFDTRAQISRQEIQLWCKMKQIYYIQTCAMKGFQVEQSLTLMAALVDKKREEAYCKKENENYFNIEEVVNDIKSSSRRQTRDSTKAWHNGSRTQSFKLKQCDSKQKNKEKCCN